MPAVICIKNPSDSTVKGFVCKTLPFGAVGSVLYFHRFAKANFTTPVALRAAQSVEHANKWHKSFDKGKGKGTKGKKGEKGKREVPEELKRLNLAWRTPDGVDLRLAWNTGDCAGKCRRVHQWVKGSYGDHKAIDHKSSGGT